MLDRACAMGELQAVLIKLGLLNSLETESLESESCEYKFQETHGKKDINCSGHP